jgi:hypothetical protein
LARSAKNPAGFAADAGISASYVSRMLKEQGEPTRKRIGEDMAARIEDALKLEPGELVAPHHVDRRDPADSAASARAVTKEVVVSRHEETLSLREPERRKNVDRRYPGRVALSVLDVGASMGHGITRPAQENIVMNMIVDENWLRRHATFTSPDNLSIVTGIGDSMQPTFEDGDPLLVDVGVREIRLDAIYVLALHDELFIKRVQRKMDGSLVIISDNPRYAPQPIEESDRSTFQVLGRVVMAWNSRRI